MFPGFLSGNSDSERNTLSLGSGLPSPSLHKRRFDFPDLDCFLRVRLVSVVHSGPSGDGCNPKAQSLELSLLPSKTVETSWSRSTTLGPPTEASSPTMA